MKSPDKCRICKCAAKKNHATTTNITFFMVMIAIWIAISQWNVLNAIAALRAELIKPTAPETIEL